MCLKFPWIIAYICGTAGQGERKFYLGKSDIHISTNLQKVHSAMFYPIILINLNLEYLYLVAFFIILFCDENPEKSALIEFSALK